MSAFLASLSPSSAPRVQEIVAALKACLRDGTTPSFVVDSRKVRVGDVFIAWPGAKHDGRTHIEQALSAGASAVLSEAAGFQHSDARVILVEDLKRHVGHIADAFLNQPSRKLTCIAVTGTNGKTSVSTWIAQALTNGGRPSGVIGTLGAGIIGSSLKAFGLTTPEAPQLHSLLKDFEQKGAKACVFEASSIGLQEGRLNGVQVQCAVFTNLTQDHLDYHASLEAYAQAKAQLFSLSGLQHVILNGDDAFAGQMLAAANNVSMVVYGASMERLKRAFPNAHLWIAASTTAMRGECQIVEVVCQKGEAYQSAQIELALIGDFNVSNAMAVLGALLSVGVPWNQALSQLEQLRSVPGRMQPVSFGVTAFPLTIVDYAHTPDALEKTLTALRSTANLRGGKLWCVFGAGGDRDVQKRPLMGAIAQRCADQVVLTSDNPRSEDPQAILAEIGQGMSSPALASIKDRRAAIRFALSHATEKDVVLIAGKGHETTQEIAGKTHPFNDATVANEEAVSFEAHRNMNWPLERVFAALSPVMWQGLQPPNGVVRGISTDSRSIKSGDLFVAIHGDTMDGHAFVAKALAQGAAAAVIEKARGQLSLPNSAGPSVQVPSTMKALAQLGRAWRNQFILPVIAVAGSNGKTTVKEMIAAILRQAHGEQHTLSTQGNFNNEIGVPQTLFNLRSTHQSAVIEMGMNHPGEMARLSAMVNASVALVNNAQREHQEFMKTVEATARENGEVILALPSSGIAVYPEDDEHAHVWRQFAGARQCVTFGYANTQSAKPTVWADSDAKPEQFLMRINGEEQAVRLHITGAHNVRNAMAAAACAHAIGISSQVISAGLAQFKPAKGRLEQHALFNGALLIDDTYNANPDSVLAAIEVLRQRAPAALVLGDMGEVGDQGPQFHTEAGQAAASAGVNHLWTIGKLSELAANAFRANSTTPESSAQHCTDTDRVVLEVQEYLASHPNSTVLVKGSRSMRMERVVKGLIASSQQKQQKQEATDAT